MSEYLDNLRLVLTSPERRAPGTISSYLSTARIFLAWLENRIPPSDLDLRRFFEAREKQGISTRSRAKEFEQLKKLYEANSWPWPLKRVDRPKPKEDPFAPAFTYDEVQHLIVARGNYTPQENFYLALATTYGPRREELGEITKRDIRDDIIIIRAKHRGRPRQHLIPEEIAPILSSWKIRERTGDAVSDAFHRIMEKSGLGQRPGWGFHSLRRTLLTLLVMNLAKNDYPPALAADYLGWSKKSIGKMFFGTAMAGVYHHPEILDSDPFGLDRICFSVHPFLPSYRNK